MLGLGGLNISLRKNGIERVLHSKAKTVRVHTERNLRIAAHCHAGLPAKVISSSIFRFVYSFCWCCHFLLSSYFKFILWILFGFPFLLSFFCNFSMAGAVLAGGGFEEQREVYCPMPLWKYISKISLVSLHCDFYFIFCFWWCAWST